MADVLPAPIPISIQGQDAEFLGSSEPQFRLDVIDTFGISLPLGLATIVVQEARMSLAEGLQTGAETSQGDLEFDPAVFPFHEEDIHPPERPQVPFPFQGVTYPLPEDLDIEISEAFPFMGDDDDDIEPMREYTGPFIVYRPETIEEQFPFFEVPDDFEHLREVIPNGNLVSFFQSRTPHEYYRNYVRGDIMKKLRTSKEFIKGKPGALGALLNLPPELFFDILEMVHPIDLLHLSRASKNLKELLQSPRAKEVWSLSYHNQHSSMLGLHGIYSPLEWTSMQYSHSRCDFCGRLGGLLDFSFNEHYCDDCQNKYLLDRDEVLRLIIPQPARISNIIFSLLVPTYRQSGRKYQTLYEVEENARYREKEVKEMVETLKSWYMTIDEGVIPDAGERFEKWLEARRNEVQLLDSYGKQANDVAMNISYQRNNDLSRIQHDLGERIAQRLTKHGHDERDTTAASSDIYYILRIHDIHRMSTKTFRKYKDTFVGKVDAAKSERLKEERREYVKKVYKDYKKTLKPEKWAYLPPQILISYEEPFNSYIRQDSLSDNIHELSLPDAMAKLPVIIEEWISIRKLELYETIPGVEIPQDPPEESPESNEGLSDEEIAKREQAKEDAKKEMLNVLMDQRMNLATCVFSCASCKSGRLAGKAIIGWDAACAHMCGSADTLYHSSWEYSTIGYAAAANIIRSLGLNPETVTPEEVDAVDARFFCGNCPVTLHRKVRGRKAYTWRECVLHAVEREEDHSHAISAWLLLSPEATAFVKHHESPAPVWQKANWGCNHCPEHLETAVTRKEAIEHVKTAHSIETPEQGVDFLDFINRYEYRGFYRRRHIFHYSTEPTCHLVCNVCPTSKVKRMWTIQDLVPHLFHQHRISMPSSTRDYYKIPVLVLD